MHRHIKKHEPIFLLKLNFFFHKYGELGAMPRFHSASNIDSKPEAIEINDSTSSQRNIFQS